MSEVETNDFEKQFLYAAKNGHLQRAERLLLDGNFDPSKEDSFILQWACEHGLAPVVSVLLKDKRIDPRCKEDVCIQLVCESGHLDVLKLLLEDGRTSPTVHSSLPFWLACQNGHTEIAKLLLQDGRVDIHTKIDNMTPLEVAVLNEFYDVAQLLLHAAKSDSVVQRSLSKQSSKKAPIKEETTTKKTSERSSKEKLTSDGNAISPTPSGIEKDSKKKSTTASELSSKYKEKEENAMAADLEEGHLRQSSKEKPPLNSIDKQKLSADECQKKLIDIVRRRKEGPFGVFHLDLKNLQDNGVSPMNSCFNEALQLLLKPSKSSSKDAGRGTCSQYTQELLAYGLNYEDLQIEMDTIIKFEKRYSPGRCLIENMLRFRNRESPVSLLKSYKTT